MRFFSGSRASGRCLQNAIRGQQANKVVCQGLEMEIETSFGRLDCFQEMWDEAVLRLRGPIYMTYDWVKTWWEFYGTGKQLRLYVFRAEKEIVALVPLYVDCLGMWPVVLKVARVVGASIPPKVFDPPLHGAWAEDVFQLLLRSLFVEDGVDVLSFGPVSELHGSCKALPAACAAMDDRLVPTVAPSGVHSLFMLPASLDDYFSGLARGERKKRQYELRLLQKACNPEVRVVSDAASVCEEFERFADQHTSQWQQERMPGHFGAWPRGREYNAALVRAHGARGRVRFIQLVANGEVVSNQFAYSFGDTYFWELPARAMGAEWRRFSLGPAGLIKTIEAAIQEGKQRLEGGLGHYPYKVTMGAREHPVRNIRVISGLPLGRLRVAFFNVLRLCLRYGYHRIWYRRATPRLPALFRRPQWSFWLRFDY